MAFADLPLSAQLDTLFSDTATLTTRTHGDIVVCRGLAADRPVVIVAFDATKHQGSIGPLEAQQIIEAFKLAIMDDMPLVFLVNSSGMRITSGMQTVAALRQLLSVALEAKLSGHPLFAMVTRHAFGGASMLASLCDQRAMPPSAILAMSGPKLIERIAGRDHFDASNGDTVRALIGGAARAAINPSTILCDDEPPAYRAAITDWLQSLSTRLTASLEIAKRHAALERRLGSERLSPPLQAPTAELDEPMRHDIASLQGDAERVLLSGPVFVTNSGTEDRAIIFGLMGGLPATAASAFALAENLLESAQHRSGLLITILVDAESHSALPADERIVLSEYLIHLALVLRFLHQCGNDVHVVITGVCGGGIFAALAAGASRVSMLSTARIQVLSPAALAALDKTPDQANETLASALTAGAVDAGFSVAGVSGAQP